MLQQTIEQLMPFLALIQQPAFCLSHNGSLFPNPAAQDLVPSSAAALPQWLGGAAADYARWDRTAPLTLASDIGGRPCSVELQPLADGTLFLLTLQQKLQNPGEIMAVAAQVMQMPLNDLHAVSQRLFENLEELENPIYTDAASAITRHLYRLTRLSNNLANWQLLQNGKWMLHKKRLEISAFLLPLLDEAAFLCREAGMTLCYTLPKAPVRLEADETLLSYALYQLLSNALKYSPPASEISFRAEAVDGAVLFRMENPCSSEHMDFLSAAFHRLEQRGVIPNPQWGVGLGLPLVQQIAALHGGATALSHSENGNAMVTMSIQRTPHPFTPILEATIPRLESGGMRISLVGLSDVLPPSCYDSTIL